MGLSSSGGVGSSPKVLGESIDLEIDQAARAPSLAMKGVLRLIDLSLSRATC